MLNSKSNFRHYMQKLRHNNGSRLAENVWQSIRPMFDTLLVIFSVRSVLQTQSDSSSVVYYYVDSIKCILKPGYGRTAPCLESPPEMKNFSPKGHGLGHVTQGIFQVWNMGVSTNPWGSPLAGSGAPAKIEFGAFQP